MSVEDSAVGAILEIPPQALQNIEKAERAIKQLALTSAEAAGKVNDHWGVVAPHGLQKFIDKIAEAKKAMDGLGTINVTLNTQAAVQSSEQLSTATQKTSQDVSKAVQDMTASWNDLAKVSLKGFDPTNYGNNITEIKLKLEKLQQERDNLFVKGSTNQALVDEIRQIEEYIRLYKLATEEKNKALGNIQQKQQAQTDKTYLDEQKRLLDRILQLRKDIANISISVQRGTITGKEDMSKDLAQLEQLRKELRETGVAYKDLRLLASLRLSDEGKVQSEIISQNAKNAGLRQEIDERNKLNQAITRANELTAQGQQGKTRLGSGEEAAIQRQLNSDYKAMLGIIREQGELKAKVASEGRQMTQQEIDLVAALGQRYKIYYDDIQRVSGAYSKMSEAAAKNFQADKSEQLARNAITLADAQNKAAEAAQKVADAEAKAEAKAIAAGEKVIAQKEAQIAKQEAAEQKAAQDYEKWWLSALAKVEAEQAKTDAKRNAQRTAQAEQDAQRRANAQANAEKEVNDILTKRIELQQKITALNTKQSISALSDPTAKTNFSDSANLQKYERQMQTLEQRLREISVLYPKLARDSESAFNNQKADLLALSMQKIADEQAKIASGTSTSKATDVEDKLNALYTERLRLLKEKEQLENKDMLNKAKGLSGISAEENQLLGKLNDRLKIVNQNITTIGQNYVGLALKAKHAYELPELRQSVQLQNQFNDALNAVDTSKTKQLVAEYKKLYAENQRLFESQRRYFNEAGGSPTTITSGTRNIDVAYREMEARRMEVLRQMRDLESKNIQEIADFRMQKDMEAHQRSISEFIQAEAQKTAEAKRQADERTRYQQEQSAKYFASYKGSLNYANAVMGSSVNRGIAANTFENRERAIKNLEAAIKSLNKADSDYEKKLKDLTDALKRLKDAQKEVNDVMKQKPQVTLADANQARKIAEQTKTLKDYETAYKLLIEVMKQTPQGRAWDAMNRKAQAMKTHIDEIKKKMGEFQSQTTKTSNIMGQLQGRIAAAFSIGAITGFIKKMVDVRAQFELQRVALGAIIQDRDEANKIFTQVQNMALQSPFSIMQLERATKQIAAFGFEAKKLVPTMKMFADISAGLGVEIDRLVLVMGHLKARNFLEGTMVRQFTNMGFNVLGELSKYYSELEDRMVSVGEVQDRVKKKMISFEDVEEVLKRVTSQGGMFYDMQKKQSDSLWGQMQRIKDATDLMLNEIGQSNEGLIKGALTALRELIQSWRDLKPVIVATVAAMGTFGASMLILRGIPMIVTNITRGFNMMGAALGFATRQQLALNAAQKANAWGALLSAIVAIGVAIYEVATAQSKLNEELERIGTNTTDSLNESIATFKQLADTISNVNSTYTERTEAMTEMRRVYAEILPKEKMEIDYIQSLRGNYGELTKAIQDYYMQKEYNQKIEAIQGSDEAKKVQEELENALNRMNEEGAFDMKYSKAMIKSWSDTIAKEINTGKIPASLDALEARIKKVFNAKDLSLYRDESYGKSDLHDVMQEVDKVQELFGDVTLNTANAENVLISYQNQLKKFDFSQLDEAKKSLQEQKDSLQQAIEGGEKGFTGTAGGRPIFGTMQMDTSEIEELKERLKGVESQIKAVDEAQAQWLSNQFKDKVEELNNVLFKDVEAYKSARDEMRKLEMQGKKNTDEWKKQEKAMNDARESADKTAKKYGTDVTWSLIDSAQTSFELRGELDKLATKAFPKVAELAMKSLNKVIEYFLKTKEGAYNVIKGLLEWIPESMREGTVINTILTNVDKNLALTKTQLDNLAKAAAGVEDKGKAAGKSFEELISNQAKTRVKEFGGNITDIDRIISDTSKGADAMAKELRSQAKSWEETAQSYRTSTDKALWLNTRSMTEESIALMEKNAKAAKALATDLAGVDKSEKKKKGAKGKDMELDMWKRRNDAIKRYYEGAEKARKNLSEVATEEQQIYSFAKLWNELGLNSIEGLDLNTLLSQGFKPDYLKYQYVEALKILKDAVPAQYGELKKDIEKAIASESIEIQFKIAEDEREKLQQSISDMFDNYSLTKELSNLGVSVDLTYMVGGKPTTLADIRREYERLMVDFASKSEEEQKIIKKMGEDLTKKEYDNRKKQLQNYVKYLAESMSERAQIEIKALHDINKIREDAELDSFSKEQAIMQRRKKMYEDLSKFDFDQFKGSDVYLSVFKDLEKASKEQLQYVLNKLKELQSTFKDLSPAQVKSIANEMKKIEDALADKDSIKNLGTSLRDAIKYAQKRNTLLKEQVKWQNSINSSTKKLSDEQVVLEALQLKLNGIQDQSSDEWEESNDAVKKQQFYIKGLQSLIESYKKKLEGVTGEIDAGESALMAWQKGMANVHSKVMEIKTSLDSVFEGLDSMGLVNDAFRDTWESIGEILGGVDTLMGALETMDITKPFSIITGSIKAIGGVFQTIGGFFGIGDKMKERQIKSLTEKVETLDKAYQKLEKSIEDAYTFSQYNIEFDRAKKNLDEQKKAYREMKALEEAKKKVDKDKVKEYNDALEEIAEKEKELRKERLEAQGSTTDYLSEAQSFVDAWLDAYKETGSGLDALGESWDEFIENLFVKQAAAQLVSARLKKVIDKINAAIEAGKTDFDLAQAVNEAREEWKKEAALLEQPLRDLFGSYGLGNGTGELILSDLQKGIQNITEPQAAAIEAYLNSMRFAVFRHTEQLETLIATIQMQYGSGAENPVVTELKGIRSVLDSINTKFDSVIGKNGNQKAVRIAT